MNYLDRRGVQHEARRGNPSVNPVASNHCPRVSKLHARLVRPTRLERELQHRAITVAADHLCPCHRKLSSRRPRAHDRHGPAARQQGVAEHHDTASGRPSAHARDIRLFCSMRLELSRQPCVCFPSTREDHDAARVAVESLVQSHVLSAEVSAKAHHNVVGPFGVSRLGRHSLWLVYDDQIFIMVNNPLRSKVRPDR
jgi:hypothetical protein